MYIDIFEDETDACNRDNLHVQDYDKTGQSFSLGRFCNTFKPPKLMYSSWNKMGVEFFSDDEKTRRGFKIKYEKQFNELPIGFIWLRNHKGNMCMIFPEPSMALAADFAHFVGVYHCLFL